MWCSFIWEVVWEDGTEGKEVGARLQKRYCLPNVAIAGTQMPHPGQVHQAMSCLLNYLTIPAMQGMMEWKLKAFQTQCLDSLTLLDRTPNTTILRRVGIYLKAVRKEGTSRWPILHVLINKCKIILNPNPKMTIHTIAIQMQY